MTRLRCWKCGYVWEYEGPKGNLHDCPRCWGEPETEEEPEKPKYDDVSPGTTKSNWPLYLIGIIITLGLVVASVYTYTKEMKTSAAFLGAGAGVIVLVMVLFYFLHRHTKIVTVPQEAPKETVPVRHTIEYIKQPEKPEIKGLGTRPYKNEVAELRNRIEKLQRKRDLGGDLEWL